MADRKEKKEKKEGLEFKVLRRNSGGVSIDTTVEFNGKPYVDIRYMYSPKGSDDLLPTRKGIMLTHTEFRAIAKMYEAMQQDEKIAAKHKKFRLQEKKELKDSD